MLEVFLGRRIAQRDHPVCWLLGELEIVLELVVFAQDTCSEHCHEPTITRSQQQQRTFQACKHACMHTCIPTYTHARAYKRRCMHIHAAGSCIHGKILTAYGPGKGTDRPHETKVAESLVAVALPRLKPLKRH